MKVVRAQIEESTSDYDKEKLQERLAKLVVGVALLRCIAALDELKLTGDQAAAVREFVAGERLTDYLTDRMLRGGAVERHRDINGDAANKMSEEFRAGHPYMPWRKILSQRHGLVRECGEISHDLMVRVATERINELVNVLEPLVPPSPEATSTRN